MFQLDQGFRRGARNFHIGTRKVKHIGRRIDGAEDPVGIQKTARKGSAQPVGKDDLKDITFPDMMLGLLDHAAKSFFVVKSGDIAQQFPARLLFLLPGSEEGSQLLELQNSLVVTGFQIIQPHIDYKDDLLPEMVKGDDLVEEHQVEVLKTFGILDFPADCRFAVSQIMIGKIPYQSTGERGEAL